MSVPHILTAKRHALLREMLEERRREIQEKLHSILSTLPEETTFVRDAEEQSVNDFAKAVDFTLMQMKSETLAKIDVALRRLGQGSYGQCIDCGQEVAEARLVALPFAERCRDCQEKFEALQAEASGENPAFGMRLTNALALARDPEAKQ